MVGSNLSPMHVFSQALFLRKKQTWAGTEATENGRLVSLYEACERRKPWLADDDRRVIKWHVKCLFLGYVLASCYKGLKRVILGNLSMDLRMQRYLFIMVPLLLSLFLFLVNLLGLTFMFSFSFVLYNLKSLDLQKLFSLILNLKTIKSQAYKRADSIIHKIFSNRNE